MHVSMHLYVRVYVQVQGMFLYFNPDSKMLKRVREYESVIIRVITKFVLCLVCFFKFV